MSSAESSMFAKHLLVVLGIAIFLCVRPKIGSWVAVVWGVIVPLEKYSSFIDELLVGSLMQSKTFAVLDIARLAALFLGTCLAALVAYRLSIRTSVPAVGG